MRIEEHKAPRTHDEDGVPLQSVCMYCGNWEKAETAEALADAILDHIATCEKRPEKRLVAQVERLDDENQVLRARLAECLGCFGEGFGCYDICHSCPIGDDCDAACTKESTP